MRRALVLVVILAGAGFAAGCVNVLPTGDDVPGGAARAFTRDCAIAPGASVWPDPCTALASFNPSPSKAEIDLAVNPKDPMNVVVASKDLDPQASDCVWSVAQVTKDGGKTWKSVYVGGDLANRVPEAKPYSCVTDPIMAFDAAGTFYYALQAYDASAVPHDVTLQTPFRSSGQSAFILARSRDGGETFDKYVVQALGDGFAIFHDYPRMIVNPITQAVHTIWNALPIVPTPMDPSAPWVSSTRDGGETVDAPVVIRPGGGVSFASGFAASAEGTVYVTIWETFGKQRTVQLYRSTDDARSFEKVGPMFDVTYLDRQLEGTEYRTITAVELAVDQTDGPRAGHMYATWADQRSGDADQMFSASTDAGKTWSAPARIPSLGAQDAHQWMGRMIVDEHGVIHVVYHDRGFDPQKQLMDAVHASSTDGGVTWTQTRLTGSGFDGAKGVHQDGFPFIGDYLGVGAAKGVVYAGYADTRTGVAEIAVARLVKAQ